MESQRRVWLGWKSHPAQTGRTFSRITTSVEQIRPGVGNAGGGWSSIRKTGNIRMQQLLSWLHFRSISLNFEANFS